MSEVTGKNELTLPQVTFNTRLESYKVAHPSAKFTMWLTQEAWDKKNQQPWSGVRDAFEKEIQQITKNPFGEASIDPAKSEESQRLRTLNKVTGPLQSLFPDKPLLIKGTGKTNIDDPKREDLIEQFQVMRRLKVKEKQYMPPEIQKFFRVADVYGAISYPVTGEQGIQEWLLMELLPESKVVNEYTVPNDGDPAHLYNAFDKTEHPELDEFVRTYCPPEDYFVQGNLVRLHSFRKAINKFHIWLRKVQGRDILWQEPEIGHKKYTLIDMKNDDLIDPLKLQ